MRKYVVVISILIAFYLDTVFFRLIGIRNFAPEALIALFVSLGVLMGGASAAAIGIGVGILIDIVANRFVGPSAVYYAAAALAGGAFYNKFYADNVIIPSIIAAVVTFLKEHISLMILLFARGRLPSYVMTVLTHILPSALLTGVLCLGIHTVLRAVIFSPQRRRDIDNR
ncbi:MAG: hypothetical protein IJM85_03725 [Clostridia bacterium]|nr:hypothetical protein [Clostridia bacterium]